MPPASTDGTTVNYTPPAAIAANQTNTYRVSYSLGELTVPDNVTMTITNTDAVHDYHKHC